MERISESLDKIVKKALKEGMWASPFTVENANKVAELLSKPLTFAELITEEKQKELWDVIGDDGFWDGAADYAVEFPENDCRDWIKDILEDWMERKSTFNPDAYSEEAEKIIRAAIEGNPITESEDEEPTKGDLENIYNAAVILYAEKDKSYYTEEEQEILSKAYDILRDYSTEV